MMGDYVLQCGDGRVIVGNSYEECEMIAARNEWKPMSYYGACRVDPSVDQFGTNPENWA